MPDQAVDADNPDALVCLAAIGRALEGEFDPRAFLDDLSAELRPLVPHDRLGIGYLADDRRTFSVFAEHGAPGFLPETDRYTTDLERPVRFPVANSPLADVFDGNVLCASDLLVDPRFVGYRDQLQTAPARAYLMLGLQVAGHEVEALLRVPCSMLAGLGARLDDRICRLHLQKAEISKQGE